MQKLAFLGIFAVLSFIILSQTTNYAFGATVPSFITMDISGTPNPNDFPYGIDCSDSQYVYGTLFAQGAVYRIDKATKAVTIFDNNAVASGEDLYSIVRHPVSGKLYMNEKDTGRTQVFNPSGSTFTIIPIPPDLSGGSLSYPQSYATNPNHIRVNEGGGLGNHDYVYGTSSLSEIKYSNNFIWQLADIDYDFSTASEAVGASDYHFHGVIKIDPNTDSVVNRYSITGASSLRGMSVDSTDSTILWITDITTEKLYKFDTSSGLVTSTITLPSGSMPRGLANDVNSVFIAENQNSGSTSKILKIFKSNSTISEIDTGQTINIVGSHHGTFSVFVANGLLLWTDESSHVGQIQINNTNLKSASNTSSNTDTNHFGCAVDTEFWFAGHGSAKVGTVSLGFSSDSIDSTSTSNGKSCGGDCYPPHFGCDKYSTCFYDDGLTINGKSYKLDNVLHVKNDMIKTPVGQSINFTEKIQDSNPEQIRLCELGIGIPYGDFAINDARFLLGIRISFDGNVERYTSGDLTAFKDEKMNYVISGDNVYCSFKWTPTKHLDDSMFAVQVIDQYGYNKMTFFNEGYTSLGMSLVGTPIHHVMDSVGNVATITEIDPTIMDHTKGIDEQGNGWSIVNNHWQKDLVMPDLTCDVTKHGYNRYCPEFTIMKNGQELIARQSFDSEKILSYPSPVIEQPYVKYDRLHDPIPNMMKARADYEIKRVQNQ